MDETVRIFVVEDDPTYARFLKYILELNPDYEVTHFDKGQDCLANLFHKPSIVVLDYSLPDTSGEEVLKEIKKFDPSMLVIIVSAQEQVGTAVKLLKLGAFDYIIKNEDTKDLLLNAINNARKNVRLINEINFLKQELSEKYGFEKMITGSSPAIKKVFSLLEKAISTNITVSISGETGTGKELIAKAIHHNSPRKNKPFVPVNIAAVPRELIESELFGHEKGAFTGAHTRRIGKFEEAQNGTIFLDEIGEMDLALQAKLLRVIQEKELTRVGGNEIIKLDVRIIVATHKNLAEESRKGNFREDLYYRLLGLPVHLPPLRERGHDIITIAKHMLAQFCRENGLNTRTLSRNAQEKLLAYSWPGNVRELKSVIELSAVMSNDPEIEEGDIRFNAPLQTDILHGEEMTLKAYNLKIIRRMLDKYDNNVLKVAEKLDIGKSTIYRYLKET
jgi:DNA-binding NtrC family response regulator